MSPEELKSRARRIADELLTQGDLSVADELFAVDCRHHTPCVLPIGARGVKVWAGKLRRSFPDLQAIVEDEIAEGFQVAQRLSLTGTHEGSCDDIAASGRRVSWQVIELLRIGPDDRFDEHWCVWDERGLRRQLATDSNEDDT